MHSPGNMRVFGLQQGPKAHNQLLLLNLHIQFFLLCLHACSFQLYLHNPHLFHSQQQLHLSN